MPEPTENPIETKWRQWCEFLKKQPVMSEIWEGLYPRVYSDPPRSGEYYPAEDAAHMFLARSYESGQSEGFDLDSRTMQSMALTNELKASDTPYVWLSQGAAQATRKTRTPTDLDWMAMHLPFPAMILMVPKGTLVDPREGDVRFIAYARLMEDGAMGRPIRMFVISGLTANLATFEWSLARPRVPFVRGIQAQVHHMLFGALRMMTTRPDLVTEPQLLKRIHEGEEPPKEFWSCRVLDEP